MHEMDEHIFETRVHTLPLIRDSTKRRNRCSERDRIVSAHMQPVAKRDGLLHAWLSTQDFRQSLEIRSTDGPGSKLRLINDIGDSSIGE